MGEIPYLPRRMYVFLAIPHWPGSRLMRCVCHDTQAHLWGKTITARVGRVTMAFSGLMSRTMPGEQDADARTGANA